MTREEALKWFKDRKKMNLDDKCQQAEDMAIKVLEQEPCEDCISRAEAIKALGYDLSIEADGGFDGYRTVIKKLLNAIYNTQKKAIEDLPSVQPKQNEWIPVSERLPEDLEAVNITWVNHEPEPYYHDIKDKNFVATGIHYRDQWYWYSTTCADYLGEYGSNDIDKVDDAIEIVAWMPLPEPYKGESEET